MEALVFPALLAAVFYFMLIRPQRKRAAQHKQLLGSLQPGDDVVTIGGMFGTITDIGDDFVELEVSPGTPVRFGRTAIARKIVHEPTETAETSSEEGEV